MPGPAAREVGNAVRPLRILLAASLVVPLLVFAGASWLTYERDFADAKRQIAREADVLHEHALKVVETAELLIAQVRKTLGDADDGTIRANEPALHHQIAAMVAGLPQFRDIWVVDA